MKVDLNAVDSVGRSPLCYVLGNGYELWVVDLLVAAGGSLNACTRHASPLHCATESDVCWYDVPSLRADVIKKLLKLVTNIDAIQLSDLTQLQRALRYRRSEKEVIQLLFDHQQGSRTIVDECGNTLLHLAVSNPNCEPSVLEFLIESGVEVDMVNDEDEIPLHLGVKTYNNSRSSIVKMLLKAGSLVNARNKRGNNPLQRAVNGMEYPSTEDVDVFKMLFIGGSRIGDDAVRSFVCHVPYYKSNIDKFNYCNMLMKCYFLENSDFRIENLIQGCTDYAALLAFGADCERELRSMRSTIVGEGRTLQDLLGDRYSHRVIKYDFNQLEIIAGDAFPVYFDIIATKIISRLAIEEILREVHVETPKYISGQKEMVVLNYHVVCNIADRLRDHDDLLRFILAFRKVDRGMCTARAGDEDAFEGKRGGEQSEECPKRPKLQI